MKEINSTSKTPKYTVLLPCRWGWFLGLKNDPYQTGSVATMGEWAPNETNILCALIRPGDLVLDVGANVGNSMLAFAAAVGQSGRVISFEPQPMPYMCLCANIALNSLVHYVTPVPMAVGARPGSIAVPLLDPTKVDNFGGVSLLDTHTTPTQDVGVITIDSLNLDSCRLIKIDVEGMESEVLAGAKETIKRHRPIIWAEQLDHRDGTRAEMAGVLKELGYKAWKLQTLIYSEHNTRLCRHNMFQFPDGTPMHDANVLAIPADVEPFPWLKDAEVFE
jgi:FkbM family methyltransferase